MHDGRPHVGLQAATGHHGTQELVEGFGAGGHSEVGPRRVVEVEDDAGLPFM